MTLLQFECNGQTVAVNPKFVTYLQPDGDDFTYVYVANNPALHVKKKYDDVVNMLESVE